MTRSFDGFLFDLGSTLIEYENIPWEFLNMTGLQAGYAYLQGKGFSLPSDSVFKDKYIAIREKYRNASKETLREWIITDAIGELLNSLNLDGGSKTVHGFFDAYYQPVSRQLTIFDDTVSVLDKFKKHGLTMGLVSNTIFPERYHQEELYRFGIRDFFDFTIFSSSFGYRKPHSSIYEHAIEMIGLDKGRILFVGDRYMEDYLGPQAVGLSSVLKLYPGRDYPDPFPTGVKIIQTLSELIPIIG